MRATSGEYLLLEGSDLHAGGFAEHGDLVGRLALHVAEDGVADGEGHRIEEKVGAHRVELLREHLRSALEETGDLFRRRVRGRRYVA